MTSYVITGASRGIGLEFVRQLSAKADNIVFGLVRNKGTATKLLELARTAPHANVHVLQADVVDIKALKAAAAEVAKVTGGTLDYLINNAAYMEVERRNVNLDEYPAELLEKDIQESIHVNVIGVIHTTNAFLRLIRAGRTKTVIALGSGIGDVDFTLACGFATTAPYSISKAALLMAMAKYTAEFREERVVFATISPGIVNTSQAAPSPEQIEEYTILAEKIRKVYAEWDGKVLTPETSVKMMLGVIGGLTSEDSGAFVSHYGNKQWV